MMEPVGYTWLPTKTLTRSVRAVFFAVAGIALFTYETFGAQASRIVLAALGIPVLILSLIVFLRSRADPEVSVYHASEARIGPDAVHLGSKALPWSELTRTFEYEDGLVLEWERALRRFRILIENPNGERGVSRDAYETIEARAGISRARHARSGRAR